MPVLDHIRPPVTRDPDGAEGIPLPPELPVALQPAVIFHAAPRRDRRLAVLLTLHVYALLILATVWVGRNRGVVSPVESSPIQTITLRLDEDAGGGPLSATPASSGGSPSMDTLVRVQSAAPDPTPPDEVLPLVDRARMLPDLPVPAQVPEATLQPGVPGGAGHGIGSGRGNGVGSGKGSGRAMFRAVPGLKGGFDLQDLEVVHEEIPVYPILAELAGVKGDVVIRVTINEKGVPIQTELLEGPPPLRAESMRAVKLWRFGRGIFRGKHLEATFDMTFRYILR